MYKRQFRVFDSVVFFLLVVSTFVFLFFVVYTLGVYSLGLPILDLVMRLPGRTTLSRAQDKGV